MANKIGDLYKIYVKGMGLVGVPDYKGWQLYSVYLTEESALETFSYLEPAYGSDLCLLYPEESFETLRKYIDNQ